MSATSITILTTNTGPPDIRQHGVVVGIDDSAIRTGKDMGHMYLECWHGITSIFCPACEPLTTACAVVV